MKENKQSEHERLTLVKSLSSHDQKKKKDYKWKPLY